MKKIFLSISLFLLLFPSFVRGEKNDSVLSKWSLSIEAGTNTFDGDIKANSYGLWKNIRGGLSLGGQLDYTFTPMLSLGFSYYYHPISANNEQGGYTFTSKHHQIAPVLSLNLIPIFVGRNISLSKWGLWLTGGLGLTLFESELYNNAGTLQDPERGTHVSDLKAVSLIIPLGVNLEYNLTKNIALGLRFQYVSNNRDDLEGGKKTYQDLNYRGVTNDFLSVGQLNLRWKFGAKKHPHTRNITMREYWDIVPNEALEAAKKAEKDVAEVKNQIAKQDDAINALAKRLQGVEDRLTDIEALLSDEGPDTDGDGVPDHRDKEPNTATNTPVDFWGQAIAVKDYARISSVFFDHDKTNLDNQAQETILSIAEMLQSNPKLLVEVRGFCDFTGDDDYNRKLSERRAKRVKQELIDVYGINADRIGTNGKGRIIEPALSYRPNRRVEFHFSE